MAMGVAVIIALHDSGTHRELIPRVIREGRRTLVFPALPPLFKELKQLKDRGVKDTLAFNSC